MEYPIAAWRMNKVYCGLDELEQAKGYLTTVIVKEHVVQ